MFPRNENRNEGTFAKTTLLETALLSPSDPFWCWQKGGFQKGGFGGCSPGTKTGTRVRSPKPPFYETALLSPSDQGRKNHDSHRRDRIWRDFLHWIFRYFLGRLIYYHYWCWRVGGAVPVKTSTGNNFPRKYQRFPRNYYQYWCWIFAWFLPFSTVLVIFQAPISPDFMGLVLLHCT